MSSFTHSANTVLRLAAQEARAFNHLYVGTEHLLVGVLREEYDAGNQALVEFGVTLPHLRAAIAAIVGYGTEAQPAEEVRLTQRCEQAGACGVEEARRLSHEHVGPEHLLLGLLRTRDGI